MDGHTIDRLRELVEEARGKDALVEVDGRTLSTTGLYNPPNPLKPEAPDLPEAYTLHTLSGLIDYVAGNRDELDFSKCLVHVVGPQEVRLVSRLLDREKRATYVTAKATDYVARDFQLGNRVELEDFIIDLQTGFDDDSARAAILRLVGNVTEKAEVQVDDDGVSQSVTARSGRTGLPTETPVPNPVRLSGRRSFREVGAIPGEWLFRMHKGPMASLREADGGMWRETAIEDIAAYLRNNLPEILHVVR